MREEGVYNADDRRKIIGRGGAFCELREHPDVIHEHEEVAAAELLAEKPEENNCLIYTSPSPRDGLLSRMPSSA